MKQLIVLACVLESATGVAFAQGDGPLINDWCVCLADNSCDDVANCAQATNCAKTTFTVAANGTYRVGARAECNSTSCHQCRACVLITTDQGSYPFCQNPDDCSSDCTPSCNSIYMHAGIEYTMTVCLLPCQSGGYSCADCGAGCRAVGCVMNWDGAKCPNP
jgi:hypothetical protein